MLQSVIVQLTANKVNACHVIVVFVMHDEAYFRTLCLDLCRVCCAHVMLILTDPEHVMENL